MSDEAKALTTAEVEGMPHHTERARPFALECSMHVLVRRDELLATTLALETAVAELNSARFARDRYANTIGLIESAIGFSGASPVEETIQHVRRLKAERDEARAEVERRDALISRDGYEDMRQHAADLAQRLEKAECERDEARAEVARRDALAVSTEMMTRAQIDQIRSEAKTLVSELETALEAIVCHWDASDEGQVRPGEIDTARAALAKAKGATP